MKYGDGNTFDFQNFQEVLKWQTDPHEMWARNAVLGSHLDALKQIYGPPTGQFKGSEFVFSVWTLGHDDLTIHLLSAPGKGCCMEVELPAGKTPWDHCVADVGARLVTFLERHLDVLETVIGKPSEDMQNHPRTEVVKPFGQAALADGNASTGEKFVAFLQEKLDALDAALSKRKAPGARKNR